MNYSVFFLKFFLLVFSCALGNAQGKDDSQKSVMIDTEKSTIEILGKTNVNEFSCYYPTALLQDSFQVKVLQFSDYQSVNDGVAKLKVKDFLCDNSQMTKDFRELLNYEEFPYVTIQLQKLKQLTKEKYQAETVIQLAGQHQLYSLELNVQEVNARLYCSGVQKVDITDFGLQAPEKFFGMVQVSEDIVISFEIYLKVQ